MLSFWLLPPGLYAVSCDFSLLLVLLSILLYKQGRIQDFHEGGALHLSNVSLKEKNNKKKKK